MAAGVNPRPTSSLFTIAFSLAHREMRRPRARVPPPPCPICAEKAADRRSSPPRRSHSRTPRNTPSACRAPQNTRPAPSRACRSLSHRAERGAWPPRPPIFRTDADGKCGKPLLKIAKNTKPHRVFHKMLKISPNEYLQKGLTNQKAP